MRISCPQLPWPFSEFIEDYLIFGQSRGKQGRGLNRWKVNTWGWIKVQHAEYWIY